MNITSAALYFPPLTNIRFSPALLDNIADLFEKTDLSLDLANVTGSNYSISEMYSFHQIRAGLGESLESGGIDRVDLYTMLPKFKQYEFGWKGMLSIDCLKGVAYLGFDERQSRNVEELAINLYNLLSDNLDIRYGFGFLRPNQRGPYLFAVGMVAGLGYGDKDENEADEITCWLDEMTGRRRYLIDHFRGAFATNILSLAHAQEAHLLENANIGVLTPLKNSCYLWSLTGQELSRAQKMLKHSCLIIC